MRARPALPVVLAIAACAVACGKRTRTPPDTVTVNAAPSAAPALPADAVERPQPDVGTDPLPPSPLATSCSGVSLHLTVASIEQSWIKVSLELRNDGAAHVPLMATGDGSDFGWRNPEVSFELTPGELTKAARCGNMNGLSDADFLYLAPGARKKLEWVDLAGVPTRPGKYTLRATYENDPTSDRLGDNFPGPRTERLVARARRTVACKLTSNAVSFEWKWTPPPP